MAMAVYNCFVTLAPVTATFDAGALDMTIFCIGGIVAMMVDVFGRWLAVMTWRRLTGDAGLTTVSSATAGRRRQTARHSLTRRRTTLEFWHSVKDRMIFVTGSANRAGASVRPACTAECVP